MYARVVSYIREQDLLRAGDRVVAGVSGGADSVCLLHVLVRLREEMGLTIRAVHVHHGLRGAEADRDAAFVEALSARWNVPCRVVRADVRGYAAAEGLSEEEAGRILRYRAFAEEAEKLAAEQAESAAPEAVAEDGRSAKSPAVKIAVAHQKEDQAETILHNLLRGSALRGLTGMAPSACPDGWERAAGREGHDGWERAADREGHDGWERAADREGPGQEGAGRGRILLIRPLLAVSRGEIREYLTRNHLEYCEDSTNGTDGYTRNRIRRLLPLLCRDVNERAVDHILAAGERIRQADAYFEREAERIWNESGVVCPDRCGIPADVLGSQPDILAGYLAMKMIKLEAGSVRDISAVHAEQIRSLAGMETGKGADLPYSLRAVREYGMIWLEKTARDVRDESRPAVTFSRFPREKNQKIPENRYTKWFDYDKIEGALSVRTRRPGDYITLKGGFRKSVKAYMIDEKIPRGERDRIPLLAEGDHVLWIVGYRISEYYKVTEETKEILQAQAYGEEEAAAGGAAASAPGMRRGQTCGGEKHGREDTGVDCGRGCE